MKAILEFDLNDPDDSMAHLRAVKSLDMALVLWELVHNSKKGMLNRVEFENVTDPYEAVSMVYERLYELLEEHGVNINQLIN